MYTYVCVTLTEPHLAVHDVIEHNLLVLARVRKGRLDGDDA